jgi:hypothetical protein
MLSETGGRMMLARILAFSLLVVLFSTHLAAENDLERIKLAIEFLKDACLRGQSFNVEVKADGSVAFLSLGGEVKSSFSKSEGLNFLNNARDEIKASENAKIRSCIEPRIDMVLHAILSSKPYKSISIIELNGFVFDLNGCRSKNRNVECDLLITSKDQDRNLTIFLKMFNDNYTTILHDNNGDEYTPNKIDIANLSSKQNQISKRFVYNVNTHVKIYFENISARAQSISLLSLKCSDSPHFTQNVFEVPFRNIPLSGT